MSELQFEQQNKQQSKALGASQGAVKQRKGKVLEDNRATKSNPMQFAGPSMRERIKTKFANGTPLTAREMRKAKDLGLTGPELPATAPANSYRYMGPQRRNSFAEVNDIDSINPNAANIPGMSVEQFQAHFAGLGVAHVTKDNLQNILPTGTEEEWGRGRDGTTAREIRGGRKWTVPDNGAGRNPDKHHHEIEIHSNDPIQDAGTNAGSGIVVRIKDSKGKYLRSDGNWQKTPKKPKTNNPLMTDLQKQQALANYDVSSTEFAQNTHIPAL